MSYLKNNYHWLLFIIVIFGSIGAVVFTQQDTDTEPNVIFEPPSPEVLQQIKDDIAARNAQDAVKPPPPGETAETGYWHGDHWHRTAPAETPVDMQRNEDQYGVTRQGTRYLKNPDWADRTEAHAIPTGPPLNLNWADINTRNTANWYDPRVWESYRNFWGFDRPKARPDGTVPYRARLDNYGTPLQQFENVSLVVKWSKRRGFRPTPEQFAEHQALTARYDTALSLGDDSTAESLRSQIAELEASAQGELPDPTSYFSMSYGDPYPDWENLSDIEKSRMNKEEEAVGIRNLYKRLGIEHLYEYYEKP